MPSGGARARGGPAPDPNALRRDRPSDADTWRTLPRDGSPEPAPTWPLTEATAREASLWAQMWRRPQAPVWAENAQEFEVATFVRQLAVAEQHDAPVAARTLLRQQMDSLGMTVPGLRANRWKIGDSAPPQRATGTTGHPRTAAGSRLRSVKGGKPS